MIIEELLKQQRELIKEANPLSYLAIRRATERMPGGVPSSIFSVAPFPLTISRGAGASIEDLDGHEYVDYGNGYGTSVFGHAHPLLVEAISEQAASGVFFGALSESVTEWAELLAERFNLDWVRFSPSGTEANMDAIRIARGLTERERIVKIEGAYHGTYPGLLISTSPNVQDAPTPETPLPLGKGISEPLTDTLAFNDLAGAAALLEKREHAAIIVEPILFNVGAIFPAAGYLAGLRSICDRTGTQLIFDEVKTGVAVAWGGCEEYFQVQPDLKTFGKGIGGGIAAGAVGGRNPDLYNEISYFRIPHLGTFSGNHLVARAGATALKILDKPAYAQLESHRRYLACQLESIINEYRLPCYLVGAAAKNCVVWANPEYGHLDNYRDYAARVSGPLGQLQWAYMINNRVWLTPGRDEQTTHSVQHEDADADRYAEAFRGFAKLLSESGALAEIDPKKAGSAA